MRQTLFCLSLAFLFVACGGEVDTDTDQPIEETPKLEFKNFEEKISYCIGFDNGFSITQVYNGPQTEGKFSIADIEEGMVAYLGDGKLRFEVAAIDSILDAYLGEGGAVDESVVSKSDASYAVGLVEGQTLVGSLVGRGIDQVMDIDYLLKGVTDGVYNINNGVSLTEARDEVMKYYSDMNKTLGESFLMENAKNETVVTTESGLQYEIINEGTGKSPNLTDSVMVHYTGRFIDGRVFETTIPSGIPAEFTVMGVIRGWQEGLQLMKEGGSRRFFIPYELGYGEKGSGPIEPYATLVFDIDLIKVKRFKPL